jgi:tol-pal system protein YbgF
VSTQRQSLCCLALSAGLLVAIPAAPAQSLNGVRPDPAFIVAQADSAQSMPRPEARAMVQLMNQIDSLNRELSQLRGKVEELNNSILNAEKRQKDMYLDLDTRLRRIEASTTDVMSNFQKATGDLAELRARIEKLEQSGGAASPASNASPGAANATSNADVLRAYEAAMTKYRKAQYQDAITAFQLIVQQYPNDPLAVNAQYWTGDSFYQLRAYRSAVDAQKELIEKYPNSPKVPDALLNMGSALIGLDETPKARETWEKLIASYPGSRAARNAEERLQRLP